MKTLPSHKTIFGFIIGGWIGLGSGLASSVAAEPSEAAARPVVAAKELLITNLNVVNSDEAVYPGPFSFGGLCEHLNSRLSASALVAQWLQTWMNDQTLNGSVLSARSDIYDQIIVPWQKKDKFVAAAGTSWEPNLANAPFRLLAIVNRIDLAVGTQLRSLQSTMQAPSNRGHHPKQNVRGTAAGSCWGGRTHRLFSSLLR